MPIKILMPALSPTMTEGNLVRWLKDEGQTINAGDVIAEIETDKATMEIEAVEEGILGKILVPAGSEGVAVNSVIAILLEESETTVDLEAISAEIQPVNQPVSQAVVNQAENTQKIGSAVIENGKETTHDYNTIHLKQEISKAISDSALPQVGEKRVRILISPLARKIASDHGLSLNDISGSGPHGRIIKNDILAILNSINSGNNNTGNNNIRKQEKITRYTPEFRVVPNNNIRKVIARRLLESKQNIPHFYLAVDCIMDAVLAIRSQLNAEFAQQKLKISVNDFIIIAAARALKEVPAVNASWTEKEILFYNNIDISVAVAIDDGLITPIIKNADQKDLIIISSEMKELAAKARENKLKPAEYQGGGFSISNLGMYGIKSFNAIINPPQSCILAIGQSSKKPVVIDDQITVKTVMEATVSCDHRIVDGAVGAKFLNSFKKYLENPILLFV